MILLFFLAEKGLLKEFERELTNDYLLDVDIGSSYLLRTAFVWSDAVNGHCFWSFIDREYQKFLKSME